MNTANRHLCEQVCRMASDLGFGVRREPAPGGRCRFVWRSPTGTKIPCTAKPDAREALTAACRKLAESLL